MKLDQVTELLPRVDLPLKGTGCEGVERIPHTDARFVVPELIEKRPLVPGETSLLLIEAPAAVGKTMLAREIAQRTGASLWNLGAIHVGDDTLRGRLGLSYGDENYSAVMSGIKQGEFLVILDGLDEGRLLAGDDNFLAFIQGMCNLVREPRAHPSIVMLGRVAATEWASTFFQLECEIPFAHVEIDFFGRRDAEELIDKRLDSLFSGRGEQPLHRQSRAAFQQARDAFFERAMGALCSRTDDIHEAWREPAVRRVLGYAPVLLGVAEFLAEKESRNYFKLANELRGTVLPTGPGGAWNLLSRVLESILKREQDKVLADGVRSKLKDNSACAGWEERQWRTLYNADDQRLRVLARSLLNLPLEQLPPELPVGLRDEYEKAIRGQLDDHPFLGGGPDGFAAVVFRDDVYAWLLHAGADDGRARVRGRLERRDYSYSPILAQSLIGRSRAKTDRATIRSGDFGYVYESLWSGPHEKGGLWLALGENDEGKIVATFHEGVVADDDEERAVAELVVVSSGPIVFPRRLTNATVDIELSVELGAEGSAFYLGPHVELRCSDLLIAGEVTAQFGHTDDPEEPSRLLLQAGSCLHGYKAPRLEGRGVLMVEWPNPQYPWDRYAIPVVPADDRDIREFGYELVDILRSLGIKGWSFLDFTKAWLKRRMPKHVETTLWAAEILVPRTRRAIRGPGAQKPLINPNVRSALVHNQALLAKWLLPEEIRRRLRKGGHGSGGKAER